MGSRSWNEFSIVKHQHRGNDRLDVRDCFVVKGGFLKFDYQQKASVSRNIQNIQRKTGDLGNHWRKLPKCLQKLKRFSIGSTPMVFGRLKICMF